MGSCGRPGCRQTLRPVSRFFSRIEDLTLVSALVAMLLMALLQIFLRNFYDSGILWAESFLRVLVLWVAMLGAMVATRLNRHISIDLVARYLPPGLRLATESLMGCTSGVICAVIAWYAFRLVEFEYEDQTIAFAAVPNWVCQAILPFGFGVMALRFGARAVQVVWRRQDPS
jgi:TRAP-type C4-dicarboxylate transport system permease small subunit